MDSVAEASAKDDPTHAMSSTPSAGHRGLVAEENIGEDMARLDRCLQNRQTLYTAILEKTW
jgi:hypothetical protein